ncbi:MAG: hypothetical protein HY059_24120 [Proteobacteria bacterium]|nr:hypothetical protein [Pseudomonadota bacterium]
MSAGTRRSFDIHVDGLDEPMRVVSNPNDDDLIDARERAALKAWRKANFARNAVPRRSELSALLLEELSANLMELDVLPDGDLLYVHCGRNVARAFGANVEGRRTSELPTPISKVFLSVYQLAIKHPMPFSTRHSSPLDDVGHWHRLILPVDAAESGRARRFVVCSLPIGDGRAA